VKCKADLDKASKIRKLRQQFENELRQFCKEDQQDIVIYLERQLLLREQLISEQLADLELLKKEKLNQENKNNNTNDVNNNNIKGKIEPKKVPIQILRSNDPDVVISAIGKEMVKILLKR
ncbi:unnamed protein product, partial [Didymodactylos carnosus]